MTDMIETLDIPKSTATRQVDYLVKNGFVNRTIPEDNRRIVELTLTDKGREIHSWFQRHLVDVMTAVRQEYSDQEVNLMITILPQVIAQSEDFLRETGHWR
jgi:DNA-binding MarR family transcriptional regulator